jgi:hypothetical protein
MQINKKSYVIKNKIKNKEMKACADRLITE